MMGVLFVEGGSQAASLAYHRCPEHTGIHLTYHAILSQTGNYIVENIHNPPFAVGQASTYGYFMYPGFLFLGLTPLFYHEGAPGRNEKLGNACR
jgi:hypothetical protein